MQKSTVENGRAVSKVTLSQQFAATAKAGGIPFANFLSAFRNLIVLKEELKMLWTIFVVLLVLWLIGMVSSYTLGGFIHLLLLIALVMLIINLISGRRPVV